LNDSWYQKEDVGQPNGTPGKKLKAGASLTYSRYVDFLYSTIGNNTNEFWAYTGPFFSLTSYLSSPAKLKHLSSCSPNHKEERDYWKIYNSLGKLLYSTDNQSSLRNLPPGVYFLHRGINGNKEKRKMVLIK
jgi:hypothetical protein